MFQASIIRYRIFEITLFSIQLDRINNWVDIIIVFSKYNYSKPTGNKYYGKVL